MPTRKKLLFLSLNLNSVVLPVSPKDADGVANSVDPHHTSWSTLFAQNYLSEN